MSAEKIDHEAIAEDMLAKAANLICDDPALLPILAEAQVHATLALVEQQSRTADALESIATSNLNLARITWITRPGWRPSGADMQTIAPELGLTPGAGA